MQEIRTDWENEQEEKDKDILVYKILNAAQVFDKESTFIATVVSGVAKVSEFASVIPEPDIESTEITLKKYFLAFHKYDLDKVEEYMKSKGLQMWYVSKYSEFKSKFYRRA